MITVITLCLRRWCESVIILDRPAMLVYCGALATERSHAEV